MIREAMGRSCFCRNEQRIIAIGMGGRTTICRQLCIPLDTYVDKG